jgi:glycosyltransferase involved in cell wall biosynthesis
MTPPSRRRNRPRVLLIAELCNPHWVSVPLEGWCHARAIAAHADVHLVTHARNRENIVAEGLRQGTDFEAFETALDDAVYRLAGLLGYGKGKGWSTLMAVSVLSYAAFERAVWRRYGPALVAGEFDLVHRLTPLSPTTPSWIAARCKAAGIPFVLGPLNGGVPWPKGFDRVRVREREFLSYVRGIYKLVPGYRATREHASAIVAGSLDTLRQIPIRWRDKVVYIPENGLDPRRFGGLVDRPASGPLKVAFVGRLVPYKCPDILVEAAAPLVREGAVVVDVIGDGPEMPKLRALVERERLAHGVTLAGWVEHRRLADRLGEAHVFGFPSVREFGGAVVLEAMASGLVPVVVNYGGPGELVSARTGFALPLGSRTELVSRFREVLTRLAANRALVREMGSLARERALRQFAWSRKGAQTFEVYRWVLGSRGKPDFGAPLPDMDVALESTWPGRPTPQDESAELRDLATGDEPRRP